MAPRVFTRIFIRRPRIRAQGGMTTEAGAGVSGHEPRKADGLWKLEKARKGSPYSFRKESGPVFSF